MKNINKSIPAYNLIADILFLLFFPLINIFLWNKWLINVRTTGSGTALVPLADFYSALFLYVLYLNHLYFQMH